MNAPNYGGPAFPQHGWTNNQEVIDRMREAGLGMTLRAWLSGMASCGLLSASRPEDFDDCKTPEERAARIARSSVNVADHIISELEKQ